MQHLMRKFIASLGFIGGLVIGVVFTNYFVSNKYIDREEIYINYYNNTEAFLDTLNQEYDWIDAFDNDNYIDAKLAVDSLQVLQLQSK